VKADVVVTSPPGQTVATECKGDGDLLQSLTVKNVQSGETKDLQVNGLFYAIGHEPATALVKEQLVTDADGYIVTIPGTAQTSVRGVFAAGDVQDKRYRQAITSAGSGELRRSDCLRKKANTDDALVPGCMAALEAERLISEEEADDPSISAENVHVPSDALAGYM
jgi:thioredoxin reductase (NADPH)